MSDRYRLIQASAHHLPMLADGSVSAIITSPPYWSLRRYEGDQDIEWPTVEYSPMPGLPPIRIQGCEADCEHEWGDREESSDVREDTRHGKTRTTDRHYGDESRRFNGNHQKHTAFNVCRKCGGMRCPLGLEPDPASFIGHLILCLREWHRLLHPTGTVWVNLGDSYCSNSVSRDDGNRSVIKAFAGEVEFPKWSEYAKQGRARYAAHLRAGGLKEKDLVGIPWRFAFAAQADGWYLRSDVIWSKANAMPESVTDRPTKAHEYIFLLAKQERYFYDGEAIREPTRNIGRKPKTVRAGPLVGSHGTAGHDGNGMRMAEVYNNPAGRNKRTVWEVPTSPFPAAHYAVFPEALVEPMVKASTPEAGVCGCCLSPYVRVVERTGHTNGREKAHVPGNTPSKTDSTGWAPTTRATDRWQPSCQCDAGDPRPAVVLDPFCGSGTTLRTAVRLRRYGIGVDLAHTYLENLVPDRLTVQMELVG